jgi:hypothetical protein
LQVFEIDLGHGLHTRRNNHHSRRRGGRQHRQQQVGEQERAEVVGGEHGLDSVGCHRSRRQAHAGVVHEDVQPVMPRFEVTRQVTNRLLRREVGQQQLDLLVAGRRHDVLARCISALLVAGHHHEGCSHPGKREGYLLAHTRVRAGDHHDLALHAAGCAGWILHFPLLTAP